MNKKVVIGKLYMDGCGHCVALEEPWSQMASKIGGKVDVREFESADDAGLENLNKEHDSNVSVQGGYPTIFKIKRGGKVEYYNGERTSPKLVSWALNRRQNTVKRGGKKNNRRKRTSKNNRRK